jgi:hypothetical protein
MKITPKEMAREYSLMVKGDERMAGLFVRDMQRIKSRLLNRIARTGSPERKKGYEVMVQRPRHKRTKRQSEKKQAHGGEEGAEGSNGILSRSPY